ncbi:Myosin-IIIb [Geodia barretti]|uniref:Myosin-IIIb n=1 Tax=Geodia barretti TaxID=519541 RepID=A0AA35W6B0_GEOBA|nr:Myosin-IIIb [Geodia barretti]
MCCISHDCQVTYEIEGFIEKNRDSLPEPVADALRFTSLQLLGILFTTSGGGGGEGGGGGRSRGDQLRKSFLRKSQRSVMRAMSQRRRKMSNSPKKRQRANHHKKLLTVSAHFRESLDLLMERLFAASPHFVRCIKPNLQKKPLQFESEFVLRQLRYTGMLEAVRVRREGYSYRPFFSDFVSSYRSVAYCFTDEVICFVCSLMLPMQALA